MELNKSMSNICVHFFLFINIRLCSCLMTLYSDGQTDNGISIGVRWVVSIELVEFVFKSCWEYHNGYINT